MTVESWQALTPFIVLAASSVVLLIVVATHRNHALAMACTLIGLAATAVGVFVAAGADPTKATPLFVIDDYALYYSLLVVLAAMFVTLMAYGYLGQRHSRPEEAYILIQVATLGAMVLAASTHFTSLFLGIELVSVPLFALVAYPVGERKPLDGGFKYLVLAGVSSAILLFGIGLIYFATGTMSFTTLNARFPLPFTAGYLYAVAGLGLVLAGIGFKLSLVPFHLWTPDVYEGAPAPVTGFLATVSKGGVFVVLLRYVISDPESLASPLFAALLAMAVASMLVGNLLALRQRNIKRILAYSSIAHLGYLVVALYAASSVGVTAVGFYLAAYFITTLGAFAVVGLLVGPASTEEPVDLAAYRGLLWRKPLVGGSLAILMFSLAGIPLTAGFIAKFYVFASGVEAGRWLLVASLIAGSAIGLYYYLRVVITLSAAPMEEPSPPMETAAISVPISAGVALTLLMIALFWLGVYPSGLLDVIKGLSVLAG